MRAGTVVLFVGVGVGLLVGGRTRADVATPPVTTRVPAANVPRVLIDEWKKAENRAGCAPVWFDDVAAAGSKIRGRYFAGGWGVTVKSPQRWGVAGAGVIEAPADLEKWKFRRETAIGAHAGYGLEGFTIGPDWLAYVHVPGQSCLYNVWSSLGKEHLEHLIDHLRVIEVR